MRNTAHSPAPDKQSLRDAVRMHRHAIDAYVDDNESVPPWLHASLMVCQRALKERERVQIPTGPLGGDRRQ